ncbi:MAG: sigma-54 dependent transcriptional regulator [Cytophagales bacterium]|nr:sigma-54 dependent transcriptional regulator [Cytophagales bacterium]
MKKILIVDDNEELLLAFRIFLKKHFDLIKTEKNPNRIPHHLKEDYDLILLDMNFKASINTGNEGLFWLGKILSIKPNANVVFITAYGDVDLAVRSLREGAMDFIQKSWDEQKILQTILSAYNLGKSKQESQRISQQKDNIQNGSLCIGSSPAMKRVMNLVQKVAPTQAQVLILGENGTGKDVIAREIHRLSDRSDKPFVSVDVSALSETLFESELFGHMKGSFTDAKSDRAGRFETASGGTLFLDEIGNLPMNLQSKLLTAIQKQEITRIGSDKPIPVDIRLLCATNKPLYQMVVEGSFREDLLYRINTIQIDLPALRDRREDIGQFVEFFLKKYGSQYKKPEAALSPDAMQKLKEYEWKGNVRELEHCIEKALILSDGEEIQAGDFMLRKTVAAAAQMPAGFNLADNEKELIRRALEVCSWNMSQTAKKLGINRSTLYEKVKKYEL